MKKNMKDLLKLGVVIPALVISLAACGSSASNNQSSSEPAPAGKEETTEAPAAQAADAVYENHGFKMTVPGEFADKVIVDTPPKSEDGVIFDVYEKASVEAAKAKGEQEYGMGWLYSICVRDEATFHRMLSNDMSGEDPICSDKEHNYYVMYHPTDVRYERETVEQMEADQEEWSKVVEWADSMKQAFIDENEGLTAFKWNNTEIESSLARTVYGEDAKYTISTTEAGPREGIGVDAEKYFKLLTEDADYQRADDAEAPDGEYVVLNFPDEHLRYDFFLAEGGENLIRQVWGENYENEQLFKVTFADTSKKASAIMQEWYDELGAAK